MQKHQERKGGQQGGQRRDQQQDRNRQPGQGQPDRFAQDEEFERKEFDDEESSQPTRPGQRPHA